jgi:tight adherence protein B
MFSSELWYIYVLIGGAALLAVQGLGTVLSRGSHERQLINRRLALSDKLDSASQVMEALRRERTFGILGRAPALEQLVIQSGLSWTPTTWLAILVLLTALFFVPLGFVVGFRLRALAIATLAAAALLYLYVVRARKGRIARFTEQLPDALDVIVRGLRAGHPFRVALGLVAREMPDPIGTEFGILGDEIAFGLDQKRALDHLSARVGQPDLSFLSVAINIQAETGGNLAEILGRLSTLLRNRMKLRLKIRALTSEGRMSAVVLTSMPFALVGIIMLIHPAYFLDVRGHPLFVPAIGLGLGLLGIANFIMYRMVHFKF